MEYKMLEDLLLLHEPNDQMVVSEKISNTKQERKGRSSNRLPCIVWRQLNNNYVLPFVRRESRVLTPNYLIKRFIIVNFQKVFSNEILSCIPYRKFQMKKCEAKAFNAILTNISDQSLIERHVFQPGDYLVNLVSVKTLIQFLVTCYDLIMNKIKENSLFGFVRINEKNQIPFIWNDKKMFVPLFYFEGESEFLDARSTYLVDSWKIWYIQFCCKLQKIRKEFHEQYPLKVVDLDDVKTLFSADTRFELCCPEPINQDFLAPEVRVGALHTQASIISNEAIEMSEKEIHTVSTANLQLKNPSLCSKSSDTNHLKSQAVKLRTKTLSVAKARQPAKMNKSTKLKEFKKKCIALYPSIKARRKINTETISQGRDPQNNIPSSPSRQHSGQQLISRTLGKRRSNNNTNSVQTEATPLCYEKCITPDLKQLQHHKSNKPMQINKNENDATTAKAVKNVKKTLRTELEKYLEHMRTVNNEHTNKDFPLGKEELKQQQMKRKSMEVSKEDPAKCTKIESSKRRLHNRKVVTNCSPNANQVHSQPLDQNKIPMKGHYMPTRVPKCVSSSEISQPICNTNKSVEKRKNTFTPVLVEESNMGVKRNMKAHASNTLENQFGTNVSHTDSNLLNKKLNPIQNQIMTQNSRESLSAQSTSPKNLASSTPVIQTNSLRQAVETSSNVHSLVMQKFRTLTPEVSISSMQNPGTTVNRNKRITPERLKPVVKSTPVSVTPQNTETHSLPTRSIIKCHKKNPPLKSPKDISIPGRSQPNVVLKNRTNSKRKNSYTANVKRKIKVPISKFPDDLEWFEEESRGNKKRTNSKKNDTVQRKISTKQNTPRCKSIISPNNRCTPYLQKTSQTLSPQVTPNDISKSHSYQELVHVYSVGSGLNPYDLEPKSAVDNIKKSHIQPEVLCPMQLEALRLETQQCLNHHYQRVIYYNQGLIDGRRRIMQNAFRIKKVT